MSPRWRLHALQLRGAVRRVVRSRGSRRISGWREGSAEERRGETGQGDAQCRRAGGKEVTKGRGQAGGDLGRRQGACLRVFSYIGIRFRLKAGYRISLEDSRGRCPACPVYREARRSPPCTRLLSVSVRGSRWPASGGHAPL